MVTNILVTKLEFLDRLKENISHSLQLEFSIHSYLKGFPNVLYKKFTVHHQKLSLLQKKKKDWRIALSMKNLISYQFRSRRSIVKLSVVH